MYNAAAEFSLYTCVYSRVITGRSSRRVRQEIVWELQIIIVICVPDRE